MRLHQLRNFNRDGNLGRCRRVAARTGGGLGNTNKPNHGMDYLTPLERRVDELIRTGSRANLNRTYR